MKISRIIPLFFVFAGVLAVSTGCKKKKKPEVSSETVPTVITAMESESEEATKPVTTSETITKTTVTEETEITTNIPETPVTETEETTIVTETTTETTVTEETTTETMTEIPETTVTEEETTTKDDNSEGDINLPWI